MRIAIPAAKACVPSAAISQAPELQLSSVQKNYLRGVLLTLFAIRVFGMLRVPLTDTTEARYAEIARKMLETGDWITPQFAYGIPFWGKPPLHTWLTAAGMGTFGVNEFGARLPIFLLSCGLLMLIYFWARAEKGEGFALVSTTILASSALFFMVSAVVMTDIPLVAGTTLSMVAFWNAVQNRHRHRLWGYLFFAGIAVGLLAKGPIVIALTGLPIGLWAILDKRRYDILQRLPWIAGLLLIVAIAAPWYVAAEIRTPGFLNYFLIGEHFQRFLIPGWTGDLYGNGHVKPHGTIWLFGILAFLPWSLFMVLPIFRIRAVAARFRAVPDHWGSYLLIWALSPLVFFTAAGNILIPYVLPALPAAALLIVQSCMDSSRTEPILYQHVVRNIQAVSGGFVALVTGACIFLTFAPEYGFNKTQKQVVLAATRIAPSDAGGITYWHDRFYSAEFYTGGRSRYIQTTAELAPLLANHRRDFFVVRTDGVPNIPPGFLKHFREVGVFGRVTLFLENPLKGSRP